MTNILLLSQLKKESGNLHTIERIRKYLSNTDYQCSVVDPVYFNDKDIKQYIAEHQIKLVIGLHAFRAGIVLQDKCIPFIMIIGGTDVNEMYKDEDKLRIMTNSILSARKIIAFSKFLSDRTKDIWPSLEPDKVLVIKQAVSTVEKSTFSLSSYIRQHHPTLYTDDLVVCINMGSIRPVKNPLYLVKAFSELHQRKNKIVYIICGPIIDKEYGELFTKTIQSLPGIIYIPGLPLSDAHVAIRQSFAFINSSNSEGMALAILEAMQLEVPVIVRDIDGNKEIVRHEETGYIFSTPEECISSVELLIQNNDIRDNLIKTASTYVNTDHSIDTERTLYRDVISSCLNNSSLLH